MSHLSDTSLEESYDELFEDFRNLRGVVDGIKKQCDRLPASIAIFAASDYNVEDIVCDLVDRILDIPPPHH